MAKRIVEKVKTGPEETKPAGAGKRMAYWTGGAALLLLIAVGVFAQNGWLPRTDPLSGERFGWFGVKFNEHAAGSNWNPFVNPMPSPTPELAKEYIYAGDRLLAVEDANANPIPPSDLAVWRPSNGNWYVMDPGYTNNQTVQWGQSGDVPAPGDYDGDGKTDFCIYREVTNDTSQWWILRSSDSTYYSVSYGLQAQDDIPVPADYDGDGKTDVAVYRTSSTNAYWHILESSTSQTVSQQFGLDTDAPTPKDFDGDGKADVSVFRDSNYTFYSIHSGDSTLYSTQYGASGDTPIPADYDGDGLADITVWRPSSGTWLILKSSDSQTTSYQWGQSGDVLVPNDYDSDGKVDVAVWRDVSGTGTWYIRNSSTGNMRNEYWGTTGDIPMPVYYKW